MFVANSNQRHLIAMLTIAMLMGSFDLAHCAVLYSEDFESAAVGPTQPQALGFNSSYGGTGPVPAPLYSVTASSGVAGSKGFNLSFDSSGQSNTYVVGFGPVIKASDISPLGNGTVSSPTQIRFSMDVKVSGSVTSSPISITVQQFDGNYEMDRGIDANHDGDMKDGATTFSSTFTPILIDGSDYIHTSFTLDQGMISAWINRIPDFINTNPIVPITPEFDPTLQLTIGIGTDSVRFGADAGNSVSVDNLLVETVPEPSTAALLVIGYIVALVGRRR
jgi:hypothetical protein